MTILVTWLWQGIVLAAVTTASLRWATRLNAATRHVIYWVALTAVLLLPAVSWLTTMAPTAPAILGFPVGPAAALARAVAPVQIPLPDWTQAIVVGAWMGMLVVGLMRLSVALGALQRLQATSRPLCEQRQRQLPMWSLARGFGRRAELRVSADLRGACAIGLGQPVIVVADTLVDALTDDELDQVVMHEHGHLMRYDDWSSLLQALISSIAGLHPAARWLGTQIDLEREAACDDYVVARTGEVRSYASCLATVAAMARLDRQPDPVLAPSATRARSTLHRRVLRLLDAGRRRGGKVERRTAVGAACAFSLAVCGASQVAPVVVFLEAETGIHASGDASVAPPRHDQTDTQAAGGIDHVVAAPDDATRQLPAPVIRRGRPAAVLASHPHLAVVALAMAPGESHLIATGDKTSRAHPESSPAAVRVDARPNPGTGLLLTAPTVEPRPVVAAVRGHDLATKPSRGPWAVTGQRAAAAGVAAGTGAKRTGTSIATFFTRASKALAQSF
jgi:beta-lactamase regulating signal transducer with metallopeptidase domain